MFAAISHGSRPPKPPDENELGFVTPSGRMKKPRARRRELRTGNAHLRKLPQKTQGAREGFPESLKTRGMEIRLYESRRTFWKHLRHDL